MTLEDCSKEELIHYIKSECFHSTRDLEFCILMFRQEKAWKLEREASQKASEALGEYIKLLTPYEGKKVSDIPDKILRAAARYENIWTVERAKADRQNKQWMRLNKQIDRNLGGIDGKS